jgi:hypothetical protein
MDLSTILETRDLTMNEMSKNPLKSSHSSACCGWGLNIMLVVIWSVKNNKHSEEIVSDQVATP